MIWESHYWKKELFRNARRVRRRRSLKRWSSSSAAGLEKGLMIGFYSIRKLIEAHTISDEIRDRQLRLFAYPWSGTSVTFMDWDKIDQKYNLDTPIQLSRPVSWIVNQMIHSFAFIPSFDPEQRLASIMFNSDRTRHQHLYVMSVDEIIGLFEEVAVNDPASMKCQFNPSTGDYDASMGPTMEPHAAGA